MSHIAEPAYSCGQQVWREFFYIIPAPLKGVVARRGGRTRALTDFFYNFSLFLFLFFVYLCIGVVLVFLDQHISFSLSTSTSVVS